MTLQELERRLKRLPAHLPLTGRLEEDLRARWPGAPVWYRHQKEHWLGWLENYRRRGRHGRDAAYVYDHIQCAPMVLWLCEATRLPTARLERASKAVIAAGRNGASQCAALRRILPWDDVHEALATAPDAASGHGVQPGAAR